MKVVILFAVHTFCHLLNQVINQSVKEEEGEKPKLSKIDLFHNFKSLVYIRKLFNF